MNESGMVTYNVADNWEYALKVTLAEPGSRIVNPGATLKFKADYLIPAQDSDVPEIQVGILRKGNTGYEAVSDGWIAGKSGGSAEGTEGSQTVRVTIPGDAPPGTYRMVFKLKDKEAVFNIIVQDATPDFIKKNPSPL